MERKYWSLKTLTRRENQSSRTAQVVRGIGTGLVISALATASVPLIPTGPAHAARTFPTWGTRWTVHATPDPSSRVVGMINPTTPGQHRITADYQVNIGRKLCDGNACSPNMAHIISPVQGFLTVVAVHIPQDYLPGVPFRSIGLGTKTRGRPRLGLGAIGGGSVQIGGSGRAQTYSQVGIKNCGRISCSFYFRRPVTRRIGNDLPYAATVLALVPRVGPILSAYTGIAALRAREATDKNQCLRVRFLLTGLLQAPVVQLFYSDGSGYCKD